jgi:hypothetical protein
MERVSGIICNSGSSVNIKSFWYEIGESFDNEEISRIRFSNP